MEGIKPGFAGRVPLFILRAADMELETDQRFVKNGQFTNYSVNRVIAVHKSGAYNTACAGGIYTDASKGGDALVAAAQSWANLTASGEMVDATIAAVAGTDVQSTTPYLSLTTGNGAALTADLFIFGDALD